jgi:hypothetical protein
MEASEAVERTRQGLGRLLDVVQRLHADDLERTTSAGWRVVATLGHLAYWDEFVAARLRRRLAMGRFLELPDELQDLVNAASEPLWHALRRDRVVDLAVSAAKSVASLIESLPEEVVRQAIDTGRTAMVDRSIHWAPHLDEIVAATSDPTGQQKGSYWRGNRSTGPQKLHQQTG